VYHRFNATNNSLCLVSCACFPNRITYLQKYSRHWLDIRITSKLFW